jgi:hypothetical protein
MDKYFTNVLGFIAILFILIVLFIYTTKTKESFFDTSDLPNGTIVILDGKADNFEGFNIYTNQTYIPDTCVGTCKDYLINSNKTLSLNTQQDGNLVIYNSQGQPVWSSGSEGRGNPPYFSTMQSDGNFVIYGANNNPIWSTGTSGVGVPPFRAIIQPDGNFVIYDKNNSPTWATGTNRSNFTGSINIPTNLKQIPGQLMTVSLAPNGDIFGTNSQFNIYHKTKADSNFSQISGKLKTINTDGTFICGVSDDAKVLCGTYNNAVNGIWKSIHKNAKQVVTSNNGIYIINNDNSLTYSNNISDLNNIKWNSISISKIRFHKISLSNNVFVGINDNNELYYADQNIFSPNPNFTKIPLDNDMKALVNVSLNNGKLLVTDVDGNLWYTPKYNNSNWQKLANKGKTYMAVMTDTNPSDS